IGKHINDDAVKAKLKYDFLGGKIQTAFAKEPSSYINTCAVRVSYTLNKAGFSIEKSLLDNAKHNEEHKVTLQSQKEAIQKYNRIDKNGYYYITSSIDMETFLWIKWGVPELFKKNMKNKDDNIKFLKKLNGYNPKKQGIITMRIAFADAKGHTTLWDKQHFADDTNFLDEYTIKNGIRQFNPLVTEAHFWEL
ncbi:T6SS effector amidase Tae4 family protein, partial [Helicobacter sp. T3_23-1056]